MSSSDRHPGIHTAERATRPMSQSKVAEPQVPPDNDDRSLMQLLAEASADDLEIELARREQLHPQDSTQSPTNFQAMVRVRELMAYRRRREMEISSLYSTARSLAALGEIDQVLDTIVHQAHELVPTDFTYLSVYDNDGSLRLRASEGTVSTLFLTARTPAGIGLADHVVRTRRPYWVRDYRAADDIVHDPDFDRQTESEGLVAVLGVPLIAGDRVFGVLYAADRQPRDFRQDEIALLNAYGDHAAVALENARLYDQARRAVDEVKAARAVIESNVHTLEHSASIQEALTSTVLAGGGVQDIADMLIVALNDDILVLDDAHQVLASRKKITTIPSTPQAPTALTPDQLREIAPAIEEGRRTRRCVTITSADGDTHIAVAAVLAGESFLGALILTRHASLDPQDTHIVERAAQILGLARLQQDSLVDAEERVRRELLSEVLTVRVPMSKELVMRARARHVNLEELNTVVVAQVPAEKSATTRLLQQMAREQGGLAGNHEGLPTLLIQADDPAHQAQLVHQRLGRIGSAALVCAAAIRSAPDSPGRQFVLAQRCCQLMSALSMTDTASTTELLGLYAVVFDPDRRNDLELLLETTVELEAYDRKRGTDLVGTLDVYFEQQGNLAKTARAMGVHVNTLLKRIERINELLGPDWKRSELALRLQFAVRLRQLVRRLRTQNEPGSTVELGHGSGYARIPF